MHLVHFPRHGDREALAGEEDHPDDGGEEDKGISVEALLGRQRRSDRLLLTLAARVLAAECMLRALGVRMDYVEDRLRDIPSLVDRF